MKKPSSKIREEIARLQEQLRAAETREAERIGRIALKAGLGDIEIDEEVLAAAFEDLAGTFRRADSESSTGKKTRGSPPLGPARRPRPSRLKRLRQHLARLKRMADTQSAEARKKDTREKIALGGLIVKAGLRSESRALLLGLLIDAKHRLDGNQAERARLTQIGAEAFGHDP